MKRDEGEVLGAEPKLSRHLLEGDKLLALGVHVFLVHLHGRTRSVHFSAEWQDTNWLLENESREGRAVMWAKAAQTDEHGPQLYCVSLYT